MLHCHIPHSFQSIFLDVLFPFPPKGVLNFVQYKFSHLAPKERQTMFELSKMFLLCLNYWKLETPSQFRQRSQKDDGTAYKVDYTRFVFLFNLLRTFIIHWNFIKNIMYNVIVFPLTPCFCHRYVQWQYF